MIVFFFFFFFLFFFFFFFFFFLVHHHHHHHHQPAFLLLRWNCSVPYREDFIHHFRCNLLTECAGGEDEADCYFHDDDRCGVGRLALAGGCYSYVDPGESLTWDQGSEVCQGQGGRLVSVNTPEEWLEVSRLLLRLNFEAVFLGLSGRNPVQLYT